LLNAEPCAAVDYFPAVMICDPLLLLLANQITR
jgi:hypothetical protein